MLPTENPRARKTTRGSITDMNIAMGSRSAKNSSVKISRRRAVEFIPVLLAGLHS